MQLVVFQQKGKKPKASVEVQEDDWSSESEQEDRLDRDPDWVKTPLVLRRKFQRGTNRMAQVNDCNH